MSSFLASLQNVVDKIRAAADRRDWERTHFLEDALMVNVLEHIRDGHCEDMEEARECARIALEARKIASRRWYA